VSIEDAGSLPQGVATALYVVAREALQNARKHASANRIVLRVERTDEDGVPAIRLVVVDDGSGFEKSEVSQADHFGLTMMDEHTMLVGGSLTIASAPGCGTSVEVRVPIAPTTQEET
jgi:signal transduction histidine kinase